MIYFLLLIDNYVKRYWFFLKKKRLFFNNLAASPKQKQNKLTQVNIALRCQFLLKPTNRKTNIGIKLHKTKMNQNIKGLKHEFRAYNWKGILANSSFQETSNNFSQVWPSSILAASSRFRPKLGLFVWWFSFLEGDSIVHRRRVYRLYVKYELK